MTTKIDIREIIAEHLDTLCDEGTGKPALIDYVVMFGLPAGVAIALFFFGFQIKNADIGTLVSVFSIFAGLLVNVLVMIYSISNPRKKDDEETDDRFALRVRLLRQSFSNISYAVVISLLIVLILSIMIFVEGMPTQVLSALVIFFSVNFGLSLLMVVKRIHVLFKDKF